MNIRKNIIILLVGLMPLSSAFAFVGFGLHFGQNQLAISDFSKSMATTSFTRGGFDNTFAVGGYFYIDAIPFFRATLASNILFSAVLFGGYYLLQKDFKSLQLSHIQYSKF